MKKYFLLTILFAIFLLTSCQKEEQHILKEVNQDIIIYSQIDTVSNHEEVVSILNQNVNMFTFCETLNISQYKSSGNMVYTVIKTTNGLFMVLFDSDGAHATIQQIEFSPIANKDRFANLKVGMTLEDARAADPDGRYDFLFHSSRNYPRISYHYFENGDCYSVRYEENVIAEIAHFTL